MKRVLLFIPLIIFIGLGWLFFGGLQIENKDVLPSPLIGKKFPPFELPILIKEGEQAKLVNELDLRGKPALVNVWATWCPTCKTEHAFLNQLNAQGVRIIGINYKDESEKAIQWLAELDNPYEFNVIDEEGRLGLDLGVYGAPETFLIDGEGVIRGKHVGDLNATVWKTLQPQFEALK